jgi:hypothetical protein
MKRRLAIVGVFAALGLAAAGSADARVTRIVSWWNGHQVGTYYARHPHKLGLVMAGTNYQGYWLVRGVDWRHWGDRQTTARGELASAALSGTPVKIRASRNTYHSCLEPGDTVYFYSRAKIRIQGEDRWRPIPNNSLAPQCNNPRVGG